MRKYLAFLLLILICSCKQNTSEKVLNKGNFNLSGIIKGNYSDYIYLNYGEIKDSVKVVNNAFEFNGNVEKPIMGGLHLKPYANVISIYIENSNIEIQAKFEQETQNNQPINFLNIQEIKGSKSAKIQDEYKDFWQKNQSKENFKNLLYKKLQTFLKENSEHPFSGIILGELALIEPVLTINQLNQLYKIIDTTKQNKYDLEMFKMGIANLNNYGIGKPFVQFELPNPNSDKININEYLGKITLVDFWASWCVPCRKKHPDLIKLKKQFKNNNFDILSISIDENKKNWIKAIGKDNLTWKNVLDENKEIKDKLEIQAIPFNYLIDEKGVVIGINVSIKKLEKILTEKYKG